MEENTSKVLDAPDAIASALLSATSAGTSLFVINLCASMAPIANVGKTLPGLETYRLYQVARREDGRTRHRLRLGFFTSETDAENVLNQVRGSYPTAFTTCLCDEDKRFARGFAAEPAAVPKMSVVPDAKPKPTPPVAARPAAPATPKNEPVVNLDATAKHVALKAVPKNAATPKAPPAVDTNATGAFKLTGELAAKAIAPKPAASNAPPAPSTDTTAKHVALKAVPKTAASSTALDASATGSFKLSDESTHVTAQDSTEIELSWDPPALESTEAAVIAPGFKTQEVIKAPTPSATKVAAPVAKPAPAPAKPVGAMAPDAKGRKDIIEAPSKLLAGIELTLESEPTKSAAATAVTAAPSSEPFRVSKGVDIPTTSLTLDTEPAPAKAPSTASLAVAAAKPAQTPAGKPSPAKPAEVAKAKPAPGTPAPKAAPMTAKPLSSLPDLDSTQTIRALTSDELKDESQEKWFAIQLAVSEQPVNLDAMPRLDIFEAYRLYSVASAGSGKITHSLRIGFFREEVSAEAVSGYLKTFFGSPTVVRISIAEQARFKDAPAPKQAQKADAKVLDLSHARAAKPVPTVTMAVEAPRFDPNATGSFKANATGTHKALSTGTHKALSATGTHKALRPATKASPPPSRHSAPLSKSATGKHKTLQPQKSLAQELLEEARNTQLSESAIRKLPKNNSLLSKMLGKLTK